MSCSNELCSRTRSSKVPSCAIRPCSSTAIRCAARIVDRRWAIVITERPFIISSMARWTWCSLSASSAEVASSSKTIGGSLSMARAIATRCFCPPESCMPRSPTRVAMPSGNLSMNWSALAARAAS
mmetsp:Transcript_8928/g.22708  ORF Transcript_8928/g.22708 Transcript_8928/m.22708 type:complete len:126 (+) Transcript_8928:414-791(+)